MTLDRLIGAPYVQGDEIEVETPEGWKPAWVLERHDIPAPFGLRWTLVVNCRGERITVRCDDNGRNRTARKGVRPITTD